MARKKVMAIKRPKSSKKSPEPAVVAEAAAAANDDNPTYACPNCPKVFTSSYGLKYHTSHKVCQSTAAEKKQRKSPKKPKSNHSTKGKRQREKNEESDSNYESSDDEDDSEEDKPIRKRRKISSKTSRGKRLKSHSEKACIPKDSAKEPKKDDETEPLVCPTCFKSFISKGGYQYHTKNSVCSIKPVASVSTSISPHKDDPDDPRENRKRNTPKSYKESDGDEENDDKSWSDNPKSIHNSESGSVEVTKGESTSIIPCKTESNGLPRHSYNYFEQVNPGSMWITKYGVVKVISDNRLPSGHNRTKRKSIRKNVVEKYDNDKHSHNCRQEDVAEVMYSGGRKRRECIEEIYKSMRLDSQSSSNSEEENQAAKIWSMYCQTVTTNQILNEKISWKDINGNPFQNVELDRFENSDPRFPKYLCADRIVECELSHNEETLAQKDGSTKQAIATKTRLFLARKELVQRYSINHSKFVCVACGKSFSNTIEYEHHVTENTCSAELKSKQADKLRRLETREENVLSEGNKKLFLSSMHGVTKVAHIDVEFGNPCKIKEHKKHKMPSWIVFNEQHSPMYPELFIAMKFKRGSQNRNWAGKAKTAEDYVPANDRRNERKKQLKKRVLKYEKKSSIEQGRAQKESRRKIRVAQIYQFALQQAAKQEEAKKCPKVVVSDQIHEFALKQAAKQEEAKVEKKKAKNKSKSSQLLEADITSLTPPPLPPVAIPDLFENSVVDETQTNSLLQSTNKPKSNAVETSVQKNEKRRPRKKKANKEGSGDSLRTNSAHDQPLNIATRVITASVDDNNANDDNQGVKSRHRGKTNPVVIDTQVLAAECDGGRYPTITRFVGVHLPHCVLCTRTDMDDEDLLMVHCDFCKNTVHQICLNKKLLNKDPPIIIRELEPHDSLMCHDCMMYCLARRARAESRRISKWHWELGRVGLAHPDAANLNEEVDISTNHNITSEKVEEDSPTYSPCPNSGPGGLICCSHCTASYSRFLSNTAKEMESQSVAKAGQEVNEILDLLADAKQRLINATDVSQANDIRRKLLRNNEV